MSLENDNMVMPVGPMNGNGGGFGDNWGSWIILFLLFGMFNGGWTGNGMNGGGLPWMLAQNTDNLVASGFANQGINTALNGIQSGINTGFGDIQTQLCGGFAGVNASINGAQSLIAQQLYSNQIADMERSFAAQTANNQNMNALQAQLAQCCCDNRLATAQTQALVQSENCADRAALSDGLRDVLVNQNQNTQRILDQLCADKIDAKNDTIAQLRSELLYARGQASQDVQTASIQSGQRALANEIEALTNPRPIPAYYVQNPNGCGCNSGCGCMS